MDNVVTLAEAVELDLQVKLRCCRLLGTLLKILGRGLGDVVELLALGSARDNRFFSCIEGIAKTLLATDIIDKLISKALPVALIKLTFIVAFDRVYSFYVLLN